MNVLDLIAGKDTETVLDGLESLIEQYSAQVDEIDNQTGTLCMAGLAAVGALIAIVCGLLSYGSESESTVPGLDRRAVYRGISAIMLMPPCIATFCLYVVADNSRKVALYRGYLAALEDAWNGLASLGGRRLMLYNSTLVDEFIGPSAGNPLTGITSNYAILGATILVLLLLYGGSFACSIYYAFCANSDCRTSRISLRSFNRDLVRPALLRKCGLAKPDRLLRGGIALVIIVTFVASFVFVLQISQNGSVTQEVLEVCREAMGL